MARALTRRTLLGAAALGAACAAVGLAGCAGGDGAVSSEPAATNPLAGKLGGKLVLRTSCSETLVNAVEDPSASARALAHLAGIVSGLSARGADAPWEYVRELLAGGALVSDKDALDAPGREERAVALTSEQRLMQARLLEPPAPESVYPVEGACVTCGCTAIAAGCSNLRQARAWVDFVTGKACQERLAAEALARPARSDVAEPEGLPDADDPIVPDRAGLLATWARVLDGTWEPSEVAPEDAANAR